MTAAPSAALTREAVTAWVRRGAVGWVALLTWAVGLPIGVLTVRVLDFNPLTSAGVVLPLALGIPVGMVVFGLAALWQRTWIVGVAAGAYAAWAGTTIAAALVGTPFGSGIIAGDAGRMSALAMHFSTTWHPSDAADPALPPEYPPLYPMLIGRVAAWTGRPAWTLLQPAQIVVTSFAVVGGFLLWRRLTSNAAAFLISSSVFTCLAEPSKGNEILSLSIYLPWLLGTFAVTGRNTSISRLVPVHWKRPVPLHPVVSGIVIGLIVPWSPQVLFLSLLGLLLVAGYTLHGADPEERRPILLRWAITVAVSLVVASWFVLPLAKSYLTGHVQVVADLWLGSPLVVEPFNIINPHRIILTLLQLAGLLGIAAQVRRVWWSAPMALFLGGVIAERAIMLIRFSASSHAFMLYYVAASIGYALNAAGVLTLIQAWRWAWPRLAARAFSVRLLGVTLAAVLVSTSGYGAWAIWAPDPRGIRDNVTNPATTYNMSMRAHAQRLPSGGKVHYPAPKSPAQIPTSRVVSFVQDALGRTARPTTISDNQAIFAFNAWPDWLMPDRVAASGLTRWDYRHGLLRHLAAITDPAAMAAGMRTLEFGPLDVMVLRLKTSAGTTTWKFADMAFDPQAFAGPQFRVSAPIGGYVVVVRVIG
jgi:hypothetical protein